MKLYPLANQIERLLDAPLALDQRISGHTTLTTGMGSITINPPDSWGKERVKEELCFNFYREMSMRIRQIRPALPLQLKRKLYKRLTLKLGAFLGEGGRFNICRYKHNIYRLTLIPSRRDRVSYGVLKGKKAAFPHTFKTYDLAVSFIIKSFPFAYFLNPDHQDLAGRLLVEGRKQLKEKAIKTSNYLKQASDYQGAKKIWARKIRRIKFFPVKIKALKRDGTEAPVIAYLYQGLAFTRSFTRKSRYQVIHGSGVMVADRFRTRFDAKLLMLTLASGFNWARSLTSIQQDPLFAMRIVPVLRLIEENPDLLFKICQLKYQRSP